MAWLVIAGAGLAMAAILGIRNHYVFKHCERINNDCFRACRADGGTRWYAELDAHGPSYDAQVLQFWRPLDSFYDRDWLAALRARAQQYVGPLPIEAR